MRKEVLVVLVSFFCLFFVSAYPITGEAIETEDENVTAGTTPDSFWYGLDVALDNIDFALTSKDRKAEKGLEIARERLLEIRQMMNENKIRESLRAQEEHDSALLKVEELIDDLEMENATEQAEEGVELEREIEEHRLEIEKTEEELKLKIKVKGEFDNETQDLIDSILADLGNSTAKIEIKIDRKKNETKIKIKDQTGKTEVEIEQEFEDIEEEKGLSDFKKERAEEMLERANDKWMDLEEKVSKYNEILPDKEVFDSFVDLGNEAFLNESYEEAKDYYEEAKDYADYLKESIEDSFEDVEKEEEIEVEVEMKGKYSKVKVKAFGEEIEFDSNKRNREEIIEEISERTGLFVDEIVLNLEFEIEEEE